MAEADRVVTVQLVGKFETEGRDDVHVVTMDEPESAGGTNLGTTPLRLFGMSLGGCAVITMRMYAERKGWDLKGAKVTVRVRPGRGKDPARVVQEIELDGDLDDEQRERLRIIAGRCPVHRIMDGPTESEERLV